MPTAVLVRVVQAAFLLAVAPAIRAAGRRDRRALGAAVVLVAAALAVRLALPAGPADVNPVGLRALVPVGLWDWERGIGAPAVQQVLLAPLVVTGTIDERVLYALTAALGALSCGLVALLARGLGADPPAAVLAGAVLALDVAHARLSHTDSPVVLEVALWLAGLALLRAHARARSASTAVAGGLLLAIAATVRAESPVGTVVALIVLGSSGLPWGDRRTWGALVPVVVGVALQAWKSAAFYGHGPNADSVPVGTHVLWLEGWRALRALDPTWTSPAVPLAAALGVLLGPAPARTRLGLLVAAIVASAWNPSREHAVPGALTFGMAHLQLRADPLVAILAGLGASGLAARLPGPAVVRHGLLGGGLLVAVAAWLPRAATPVLAQAEDAFVLDHRGEIPEDCTIVMVWPRTDGGLVPFRTDPEVRPGDPRWRWTRDRAPAGCLVWYRAATCALTGFGQEADADAAAMRADCAAFEAAHPLAPIAEAGLRGGSWMFDRYVEDPVRVGFYRVR